MKLKIQHQNGKCIWIVAYILSKISFIYLQDKRNVCSSVELFSCLGMKSSLWSPLISPHKPSVASMSETEARTRTLLIHVSSYDKSNETLVPVGNVAWNLTVFNFFFYLSGFLKSWYNFWVNILLPHIDALTWTHANRLFCWELGFHMER